MDLPYAAAREAAGEDLHEALGRCRPRACPCRVPHDLPVAGDDDHDPARRLRRHQLLDDLVRDDALRAEHHSDAAGRRHDAPGRGCRRVEDDRGLRPCPRDEGCQAVSQRSSSMIAQ